MKKYIIYLLGVLLFYACGGSSDDPAPKPPSTPPSVNKAPTVPNLIDPADGLKCTDKNLEFAWGPSIDSEGDNISYYIQLATNNTFTENLQVKTTNSTTASFELIKGVAYYWRMNAKDSKNNASAFSVTRKFYSEGDGVSNHLPYAPSVVSPSVGANISDATTTLSWTASDADNDPLKYDVYFGNSNSPALIVENLDTKTYEVDLIAATTYYWKVVVKDDAGGETIGQVWSFKTE